MDITFGQQTIVETLHKHWWFTQTKSWAWFSGVCSTEDDKDSKVSNLNSHTFFVGPKSVYPTFMLNIITNYTMPIEQVNLRMSKPENITVQPLGPFLPGGLTLVDPVYETVWSAPAKVYLNYNGEGDYTEGISDNCFEGKIFVVAVRGFYPIIDPPLP